MKHFTVYDPATGKVIRSGSAFLDADAEAQANPGEAALVGVQAAPDEIVDLATRTLRKCTVGELPPKPQAQPDRLGAVLDALKYLKSSGQIKDFGPAASKL